jgi:hypothetical protein
MPGTGSVYQRRDGYWIGEVIIGEKRRRVTDKDGRVGQPPSR